MTTALAPHGNAPESGTSQSGTPESGTPNSSAAPRQLTLPAIGDTGAAPALHAALRTLVATPGDIALLAHEVDRIGTACAQVLLAAGLGLQRRGFALMLRGPSPAFRRAFVDLGLSGELQRWSAADV
jgi:anti-anti-sigma regulatory factor